MLYKMRNKLGAYHKFNLTYAAAHIEHTRNTHPTKTTQPISLIIFSYGRPRIALSHEIHIFLLDCWNGRETTNVNIFAQLFSKSKRGVTGDKVNIEKGWPKKDDPHCQAKFSLFVPLILWPHRGWTKFDWFRFILYKTRCFNKFGHDIELNLFDSKYAKVVTNYIRHRTWETAKKNRLVSVLK